MKITKRGEYAIRSLLALSHTYGQKTLSLRQIAEHEKLPVKFLEQIMMTLKQGRIVESVKGKHGGYSLRRSPDKITLGEIIRMIDGPLAPIGTAKEMEKQMQKEELHPGLYFVLLQVRNAISKILDKITLADVCEKSSEINRSRRSSPMYYI